MLTGAPPFTATDPMELIHGHIARQPLPPHQRLATVPDPVSSIVMRLLAKTTEERYQTAAGVERRSAPLPRGWEASGRIDPFPLGAHDTSDQFLIPEKLYGREREVETLLAAFDRVVASGMPELVLVSGYPGIGKSSVVNELRKALVSRAGCSRPANSTSTSATSLTSRWLRPSRPDPPILGQDEAELARWRDASDALGPMAS